MTKQLKLSSPFLSLRQLVIMYLIWFFLTGFYEMTKQLVLEGSVFLTQMVHYAFFITTRLLFIPILIYVVLIRQSILGKRIGLTRDLFWKRCGSGLKIGLPLVFIILFFVHLPLAYSETGLRPLVIAVAPEEIAISLVYFTGLFFMALIPAFSEELLFRGLTFPFLEERLGKIKALFLTGFIYGLFYLNFNLYIVAIRMILGLFTTYLFMRSRNLIPAVILQAIFHATFVLYVFGWGWW